MTKQPTVKAACQAYSFTALSGKTFVQDETEAGWSPKDKLWVTCLLQAATQGKRVFASEARIPESCLLPEATSPVQGWGEGARKGGMLLSYDYQISNK